MRKSARTQIPPFFDNDLYTLNSHLLTLKAHHNHKMYVLSYIKIFEAS